MSARGSEGSLGPPPSRCRAEGAAAPRNEPGCGRAVMSKTPSNGRAAKKHIKGKWIPRAKAARVSGVSSAQVWYWERHGFLGVKLGHHKTGGHCFVHAGDLEAI